MIFYIFRYIRQNIDHYKFTETFETKTFRKTGQSLTYILPKYTSFFPIMSLSVSTVKTNTCLLSKIPKTRLFLMFSTFFFTCFSWTTAFQFSFCIVPPIIRLFSTMLTSVTTTQKSFKWDLLKPSHFYTCGVSYQSFGFH